MKTKLERLENVIKDKRSMDIMYNIFLTNIELFIKNPTVLNKKEVIQSGANFNSRKTRLMHRIKDFWCKYE